MMRRLVAVKFYVCVFGFALGLFPGRVEAATSPSIAPEFINFGYIQNNNILPYVQFETFTHVAAPFVDFLGDGSFQSSTVSGFVNRHSALRPGGAAQRAGTKVILCVRNRSFNETILADVMQSASRRAVLVNNVRNLVVNDPYCAGVNFDFEFSWSTATRDGITAFLNAMRAALPDHEISVYTHAIYNADRWNFPAFIDNVDYLLYSTYDWGTGSRPHGIADYDNILPHLRRYLEAGVPPEKLVLTWASYGRRWVSSNPSFTYGDIGSGNQSQGFHDTLFNTTLRQSNGGPFTPIYLRGDETVYYRYSQFNSSTNQTDYFVGVGESPESLELKISTAMNFPGHNGLFKGLKLRGVGWWSMMWVAPYWQNFAMGSPGNSFSGFDPIAGSTVGRAPYYRHIDLKVQELLKKPGQTVFRLESFENDDPHWRDPNSSPDSTGDTDSNSAWTWVGAPGGANRPPDTSRAGRLFFDFEAASGNKLFMRYEMLGHPTEPGTPDANAALALISRHSRISGYYFVQGNYSSRQLRLAAVDGLRQVEVSKPIPLPSTAGWYQFSWDLNDPAQVDPWVTNEPYFESGNGVVDSKSPGERDVSFLGFIVEGGGSGAGYIYFDEITYEDRAPDDKAYVINEFRYGINGSEFVEIAGPAGPVPPGLRLVTYNSSDATEYKSVSLAGRTIPESGLFVIGDAGVPGATGSTGFVPGNWSSSAADLPTQLPGSIQLRDSSTGFVYDSVVYGAFGGIQELARVQTHRVAGEGYGWLGGLGSGTDSASQYYTMGRMPDGADTHWNQRDFSFMPSTPGAPNGAAGLIDTEDPWNFASVPPGAFQTYQSIRLENPVAAGLPASPGGGNAYRCVDTNGGGLIGVFGDAEMGGDRGLDITGHLYIPNASHPAQAVAVGFCATQGSTFFSPVPNASGYEDGYWLIYENKVVDLNDGQPNHPGTFQLVMASNDNLDQQPTQALGPLKALGSLGVTTNSWASFRLRIDPTASAGEQLVVQVGGVDVYRGPIPDSGPTKGAFVTGFRETNDGVTNVEGTWIDDLHIQHATPPARVIDYELY